jgi:hypothetical protein
MSPIGGLTMQRNLGHAPYTWPSGDRRRHHPGPAGYWPQAPAQLKLLLPLTGNMQPFLQPHNNFDGSLRPAAGYPDQTPGPQNSRRHPRPHRRRPGAGPLPQPGRRPWKTAPASPSAVPVTATASSAYIRINGEDRVLVLMDGRRLNVDLGIRLRQRRL